MGPEDLEPPEKPQASLPIKFEQRLVPQIPPDAWRKLSPDQLFDLANQIMAFSRETENRRFEFERAEAARAGNATTLKIIVGSLVFAIGLGAGAYLAVNNQPVVGSAIIATLATLVAVVIGRHPHA